jgi:hypothetical protein
LGDAAFEEVLSETKRRREQAENAAVHAIHRKYFGAA